MFKIHSAILFALTSHFSTLSMAMLIQHDGNIEDHMAFAKVSLFDTVGRLNIHPNGICTGTLIDERTVLTAAHCAVKLTRNSTFTLSIGTDGFANLKEERFRTVGYRVADVKRELIDPCSVDSFTSSRDDVALVYLDYPLNGEQHLDMEQRPQINPDVLNEQVYISGYGKTGYGDRWDLFPNQRKLAGVTYIVKPDLGSTDSQNALQSRFLYGGFRSLGASTAPGDSGAPIIAFRNLQHPMIIGVHSGRCSSDIKNGWQNWVAALNFMKRSSFIDKAQYLLGFEYPSPKESPTSFQGYLTRRYHAYVGRHASFVGEGKAVVSVSSHGTPNQPHYWSEIPRWTASTIRANFQTPQISNGFINDALGYLPTHFKVNIQGSTIVNGHFHVDSLSLNSPSSHLVISNDASVSAIAVRAYAGQIVVDGVLQAERLTMGGAELSGFGRIIMSPARYPDRIRYEMEQADTLINRSGHVNLANGTGTLTIEGGYQHTALAKLSVAVLKSGASSKLDIDESAVIAGGTIVVKMQDLVETSLAKEPSVLRLQIGPNGWSGMGISSGSFADLNVILNPHRHQPNSFASQQNTIRKERRWTILQAKQGVFGQFDHFWVEGAQQAFELEYLSHRVDLVLRTSLPGPGLSSLRDNCL